jgi:hypothetical protein
VPLAAHAGGIEIHALPVSLGVEGGKARRLSLPAADRAGCRARAGLGPGVRDDRVQNAHARLGSRPRSETRRAQRSPARPPSDDDVRFPGRGATDSLGVWTWRVPSYVIRIAYHSASRVGREATVTASRCSCGMSGVCRIGPWRQEGARRIYDDPGGHFDAALVQSVSCALPATLPRGKSTLEPGTRQRKAHEREMCR